MRITKQQRAYGFIREQIRLRRFLPGQRVVAADVAKEIGISILPVREALVKLESEGVVTLTPHVGAVVTVLSYADVASVIEPLAVLEGYLTRVAMSKTSSIISELHAANDDMERASEEQRWDAFSAGNRRFHQAIYDACENGKLLEAMRVLSSQMNALLGNNVFMLIPERVQGSISEHRQIIDMLRDSDTDPFELELFARNHKLATQNHLERMARSGALVDVGLPLE